MYDPRIARWLTTDPAYVHWSPYLAMGNNPLIYVDPNGEDPEPCIGDDGNEYVQDNEIFELFNNIVEYQAYFGPERTFTSTYDNYDWAAQYYGNREFRFNNPSSSGGFDWGSAVANAEDALIVWAMADAYLPIGDIAGIIRLGGTKFGARLFGSSSKWVYGAFKSEAKWASQLTKRGWTPRQITEAITKGKRFDAVNMVNQANKATRYVHPQTGQSVVIDNVTRELLHVGGVGFKY